MGVKWANFLAPLTMNTAREVLYSLDLIQIRLGDIAPDVRTIVKFAEDRSIHNGYKCFSVKGMLYLVYLSQAGHA